MEIQQDHHRQNLLLKEYMNKYFSPNKIEELVGEFSFSELRRLLGEMDIEFFALCYFPKYFDRKFGQFHKEMQNDPRSTDDYIFQDIECWSSLPEYEDMEVVMYIDPAIKAGKRNDYSAITVLGRHRKTKQMYIIDGTLHKVLPDDLFKVAIEKLKDYPVEKIGFEATQAQSYMKQKFEEELWKAKVYVPVEAINSKGQKHERISNPVFPANYRSCLT